MFCESNRSGGASIFPPCHLSAVFPFPTAVGTGQMICPLLIQLENERSVFPFLQPCPVSVARSLHHPSRDSSPWAKNSFLSHPPSLQVEWEWGTWFRGAVSPCLSNSRLGWGITSSLKLPVREVKPDGDWALFIFGCLRGAVSLEWCPRGWVEESGGAWDGRWEESTTTLWRS